MRFLDELGHDAVHVRTLAMHSATNKDIASFAESSQRTVLTFDLDFGDILALGVLDRPSAKTLAVAALFRTGTGGRSVRIDTWSQGRRDSA